MSNRTIPPFLKKLVQVTDSCPSNIGSWNEDGTQFVVTSSQFADVLRKHFQGSLQTFVRQLHFYSFQKKDDGAKGIWTFSHPNFRRGQPHLLANIERKLNSKKKTTKKDDKSEDSNPDANSEMILARLVELEEKAARVDILEKEVATLREEMRDYITAQSLSSLDPEKPFNRKRKTVALEETVPKEIVETVVPPRPSKINRLTSVDSIMELKDFPFEDTSSLGSVSVKDFMRELQFGIFSDFDEFLPPSNSSQVDVPSTPLPDMSDGRGVEEEVCKKEMDIPQDFVISQGISRSLLKETFEVMATLCCPRGGKLCHKMFPELRKLCDEHPHPSTLPPVELCPIGHELLPTLREHVKEPATDLQLIRAARHTYEIYYQNMMKKLNEANKH